ncbi:programmed cell death protein 7 isoform X1 [Scyliorhinus torazame]|uniref:programmed cell death protein 7 isoform X1 n=1 Tax=Scyliorhinus torazame TaxID=75743 RepID=UPI003B59C43D
MERPPPFYGGLPERRHGPPLPPAAEFGPRDRGRLSFCQPGSKSEESPGAAFPHPRQHGFPVPERGLAQNRAAAGGDWGPPASPAESYLQPSPGGPAPTAAKVEPLEEHRQPWDQGHRDHLPAPEQPRNQPQHKRPRCPPQPWGRDHPPHPRGQQHPDHPLHPRGHQHPDHPLHPQGHRHPDQPPRPQGQQHLDHPPHPKGQQHPDQPPRPQGQQHPDQPPHPPGQQHPDHPPHLQGQQHPDHPQGQQNPDYPPHQRGQQHRDHPSHPQGQQHQNHPQGQQHRDHPPHPQGQQHPDYPTLPQGQQHPGHSAHPKGQQIPDHPSHPQGQQHPSHPPHPQGQQHLNYLLHPQGQQHPSHHPHSQGHPHQDLLSLSQGHKHPPDPWNHHQSYTTLPQDHEHKERLPQVQRYECRDQPSLPQGFSHQDHSADQYWEHYPQQGQPYHCPQPPYLQEHMDSQHQYPFHERLHPEQLPPLSESAGVASSVPPHIHSMPPQPPNSSCQDHSLLRSGTLNLPAGYGPQNSQLINHSIHNNQQNFPNSLGEIPSWQNDHSMQYNNENMTMPWPSVANFSQNLKDISVEQLHRNDLMMRKSSPDQFSHNFKYESLKEQDELWLTRFLSKRRSQPSMIKKPKSSLLVSEVKESVLSACKLVAELTTLCQKLRHNIENEAVWTESYLKAIEIKTALQEKLKMLNDSDYLSAVKKKLERIKKKRSSIQRKKQEWLLEKQEEEARAAEREAKIDEWRMKCVRKVEEKKRERELKAAADSVLSEVRKKQADAKRLTDILRALEKLRKLRKEAAARKGVQPPPSADQTFEHHIERLRKLIKKRSELYDAEERALRVMLEGEQEEERKRENEKKLKKEREKLEKQQREMESMMFGDPELPSDHPLQPFRQYYLQAEHSSHVLVQIRQEWDRYLVPEDHPDGSCIPQGWVFPHPPSTDTWATALQQNES